MGVFENRVNSILLCKPFSASSIELDKVGWDDMFVLNLPVKAGKKLTDKVEKIWEDSLDLIPSPSPSVKSQNIGGKVYLR